MKRTVLRHRRAGEPAPRWAPPADAAEPARSPGPSAGPTPSAPRSEGFRRLLTAAQQRQAEERTAREHGMPVALLMENAGEALAAAAQELASATGRFFVLCGCGNNGGDGLVAARKLKAEGREVQVERVAPADAPAGEVARNLAALRAAGVADGPIRGAPGPGDVVIDALLGTGLNRAPEGELAGTIARIAAWRAAGAKVLAADLPSGLASDTGQAPGPCVQADATVSFGGLKVGQLLEPGASACGALSSAQIGIPDAALAGLDGPAVFALEERAVRARLPARMADTHKGTYGHVLVVAGSWGKSGAAALAGLGALRGGAGLVTVACRPDALLPAMAHAPELMGRELVGEDGLSLSDLNSLLEAADGKDAVVIGPGIARGQDTGKLLKALLEELTVPCVLDADALNALGEGLALLRGAAGPVILTPHPGEAGRLLGTSAAQVQADRLGAVRALAADREGAVVLKGARTLIGFPDGTVWVNPTGNPGMATGGTGDVLSGVLGALCAQGLEPADAAAVGVFAHGLAGDLRAAVSGRVGLIATDLLEGLGAVWARWGR